MSDSCPNCNSTHIIKKGKDFRGGRISQRYKCLDCSTNFYCDNVFNNVVAPTKEELSNKTYVITCAVNGVGVNIPFLTTLESYCASRNAQLIIVPVKYSQGLEEGYSWDERLHKYFVNENITLTNGLKLLAGIHISPAIGNPLSGFETFSKGDSIILPHPQMMMKTIAMSHVHSACMITTTGSVTNSTYTQTKQGEKANFNHSYSALVVEEDSDINSFHVRVLNSDTNGSFYDVDRYYDAKTISLNTDIPAIIIGDEHIIHVDPAVTAATFTAHNSIVKTLNPQNIVRHDSLDFYAANHHHQKQVFTQYAKFISGKNDAAAELNITMDYILKTTPSNSKSIIISSNHNDHLCRWLQECNPKLEPWNALLYHELMYLMLKNTKMGKSGAEYPNPFALWFENNYDSDSVKFVSGYESFELFGIELAFHGHQGTNGSKGTAEQFAKLGTKTIIGHSHCFVGGHSALTKSGWKPIKDVMVGEFVLAFDHKTNSNIWVHNKETHVSNYTGYIIDIKNRFFRQSVTENHNLFTKNGEYINACQAIITRSPNEIPLSSRGIMEDSGITIPEKLLRQIVAVCADGNFYKKSLRFHVKKERKKERLLELFSGNLTSCGVVKTTNGNYKIGIAMNSDAYVDMMAYITPTTEDKCLPDLFRNLTRSCKEIVLDELNHWDGTYKTDITKHGFQFSTAKKSEADLISSICVELGFRTTMNPREIRQKRGYALWVISWCTDKDYIWSTEIKTHADGLHKVWNAHSRLVENEEVSCLTTEVSNFWVKHDNTGQVSLTGNSPSIFGGCYTVGHSCYSKLEYNSGPSSWAQAHCIIQPNGKRQMLFINKGKWRR